MQELEPRSLSEALYFRYYFLSFLTSYQVEKIFWIMYLGFYSRRDEATVQNLRGNKYEMKSHSSNSVS